MKLYIRYTATQKDFIKQHYLTLSNAEIAQALGIDKASKVRDIARKQLGLKWRAENGAPRWREPKSPNHNSWQQAA